LSAQRPVREPSAIVLGSENVEAGAATARPIFSTDEHVNVHVDEYVATSP